MRHTKLSSSAEIGSARLNLAMSSTTKEQDLDCLPDGYYRSKNFIGSLVAVCLMALSLYLGYTLPVR